MLMDIKHTMLCDEERKEANATLTFFSEQMEGRNRLLKWRSLQEGQELSFLDASL